MAGFAAGAEEVDAWFEIGRDRGVRRLVGAEVFCHPGGFRGVPFRR